MTDRGPACAVPGQTSSARRLLVLACSARKRATAGLLPAVDRYDGPAFRVLRKFLAETTDPPDVLVLSARFGLIPADTPIPAYDHRLTPAAADALRPAAVRVLGEMLSRGTYADVAFGLGRDYRRAVAGYPAVVPPGAAATILAGGQGARLRALRTWLRRDRPPDG